MVGELEELGERIAEHAAHLDAATHRLLADLRDFDRRGGWYAQGALSCAHWLAWRVGWDLVTARERVRVAGKLADFPLIDDALRRGELSYSKVRALLRIASPANEVMILEYARLMTASQLEKLSRKYALVQRHGQEDRPQDDVHRRYIRRRDTDDGMVKIEAVLHPEEAEIIWTMLDHAAKHLGRASHPEAEAPASPASAESRGLTDAHAGTTTTLLSDVSAGVADASAESCGTTRTAHPACAMAASAESRWGTATHASTTTTLLSDVPAGMADASAESRGLPDIHTGIATHILSDISTHQIDTSAESHGQTDPHARTTTTMLSELPGDLADASAESRQAVAAVGMASAAREPGVLHQQVDATRRAFSRADALLSVAQAYLRGDRLHRAPVEVTLTIPARSLGREPADAADAIDAVDAGWMGGSCVSTEAARRLSCDAGVIEVVEDDHGVPLSVGRKRRTIAGSIKRALLKRDTACSFPGCTHQTFLEGHHIKHWADGGETSLDNLSLLCSHHHRYVHEYGYAIELGLDNHPRFHDPSGRLVAAVPGRATGPELGWPRIRAENELLAIDAETIACEWDGRPVEYGRVIDKLVVVDDLR
jgi:hypothetical protein